MRFINVPRKSKRFRVGASIGRTRNGSEKARQKRRSTAADFRECLKRFEKDEDAAVTDADRFNMAAIMAWVPSMTGLPKALDLSPPRGQIFMGVALG